jgi:Transcription factor WhiB
MNAAMLEQLFAALRGIPRLPGALCVTDPELWDNTDDPVVAEQAAELCLHRCPALSDCAAWSSTLSNRELSGVVAGVIRPWEPRSTGPKAAAS